jgi:histidinol phosphatase-like enzyme (inositol monophosphatase family)
MQVRQSDLEFAVEVARRAGDVTLRHFRAGVSAELKPDRTPVTEADREAERVCRRIISDRFPHDGILGEEYGLERADAARRWILDPIDGTRTFVRGVPLYGVLVALEENREARVGVIHLPALGETVAAGTGLGCWWNDVRCRVSSVDRLEHALVLCTDSESFAAEGHRGKWSSLAERAGTVRTWGDCYGHALVATGRAEAMVDPVLADWDAAALLPILDEAGGRFTDWHGRATHRGGSGVSTNSRLAESLREVLGIPGSDAATSVAE